MTKPPTLEDASERGLLAVAKTGIYTFSNGTEWEMWAAPNCDRCKYFDPDKAGGLCAFEGAAMLDMVSPEMGTLFGWTQRTTEYGPRDGWEPPQSCPFFTDRDTDDGDAPRRSPPHDPAQLVLIADPTEVIANLTPTVREEEVTHV